MIGHNHECSELCIRKNVGDFVPDLCCGVACRRGDEPRVSDLSEEMISVFRTYRDEISGIVAIIPPLCPCRRDAVFVFEFVHLVLVLSPVETRLIASLRGLEYDKPPCQSCFDVRNNYEWFWWNGHRRDAINRVSTPGGWNAINRLVNRVLMPGTITNDCDEMTMKQVVPLRHCASSDEYVRFSFDGCFRFILSWTIQI